MANRSRPREVRRPSHRRDRSLVSIFAALTLLIALVAGGVWLYAQGQGRLVETDSDTLCPTDIPIPALTVVLLDLSNKFSQPQLLRVRNELIRLRDTIPRFGLLELYEVGSSPDRLPVPILRLCNPGKGDDLSSLYENPKQARQRWTRDFASRLTTEMERLLSAPGADQSRIFEAIQAIALRSFGNPAYDHLKGPEPDHLEDPEPDHPEPRRLVIVSDLLQHAPDIYSHYRGAPNFDAFKNSPYYFQVRADLDGVVVYAYYLQRSDVAIQGVTHIEFWNRFFAEQGATGNLTVDRVYGDQ